MMNVGENNQRRKAFRYVDGRLTECDNVGHLIRIGVVEGRRSFDDGRIKVQSSKRRALARVDSGPHRHAARSIPSHMFKPFARMTTSTLTGHPLRDSRGFECVLYLPEGAQVTDAQCEEIDRVIRRAP